MEILGTLDRDILSGTIAPDSIFALSGNDIVAGLGGERSHLRQGW